MRDYQQEIFRLPRYAMVQEQVLPQLEPSRELRIFCWVGSASKLGLYLSFPLTHSRFSINPMIMKVILNKDTSI